MPGRLGLRALKSWRWVGCFSPELMLCAARVRVGPARQTFWALYDRRDGRLLERTGHPHVDLRLGRLLVADRDLQLDLRFSESAGIETISASGDGYAWTRKQGGLPAHGRAMLDGRPREFSGAVIVDDSAGYHARHTHWRWCAGVGTGLEDQALAWNLVEGIHDAAQASERTLWVDGIAHHLPPTPIAADLSAAGLLRFDSEVTREQHQNRLIVSSHYRQPFGTFSGAVGNVALDVGYGVMEEHDVYW